MFIERISLCGFDTALDRKFLNLENGRNLIVNDKELFIKAIHFMLHQDYENTALALKCRSVMAGNVSYVTLYLNSADNNMGIRKKFSATRYIDRERVKLIYYDDNKVDTITDFHILYQSIKFDSSIPVNLNIHNVLTMIYMDQRIESSVMKQKRFMNKSQKLVQHDESFNYILLSQLEILNGLKHSTKFKTLKEMKLKINSLIESIKLIEQEITELYSNRFTVDTSFVESKQSEFHTKMIQKIEQLVEIVNIDRQEYEEYNEFIGKLNDSFGKLDSMMSTVPSIITECNQDIREILKNQIDWLLYNNVEKISDSNDLEGILNRNLKQMHSTHSRVLKEQNTRKIQLDSLNLVKNENVLKIDNIEDNMTSLSVELDRVKSQITKSETDRVLFNLSTRPEDIILHEDIITNELVDLVMQTGMKYFYYGKNIETCRMNDYNIESNTYLKNILDSHNEENYLLKNLYSNLNGLLESKTDKYVSLADKENEVSFLLDKWKKIKTHQTQVDTITRNVRTFPTQNITNHSIALNTGTELQKKWDLVQNLKLENVHVSLEITNLKIIEYFQDCQCQTIDIACNLLEEMKQKILNHELIVTTNKMNNLNIMGKYIEAFNTFLLESENLNLRCQQYDLMTVFNMDRNISNELNMNDGILETLKEKQIELNVTNEFPIIFEMNPTDLNSLTNEIFNKLCDLHNLKAEMLIREQEISIFINSYPIDQRQFVSDCFELSDNIISSCIDEITEILPSDYQNHQDERFLRILQNIEEIGIPFMDSVHFGISKTINYLKMVLNDVAKYVDYIITQLYPELLQAVSGWLLFGDEIGSAFQFKDIQSFTYYVQCEMDGRFRDVTNDEKTIILLSINLGLCLSKHTKFHVITIDSTLLKQISPRFFELYTNLVLNDLQIIEI